MKNESQIAVLVELSLIHGHVGVVEVLAMHDWTHRNLMYVILFFIIKKVFQNFSILLKVVSLFYQVVSAGFISSEKIFSAAIVGISLNDLF